MGGDVPIQRVTTAPHCQYRLVWSPSPRPTADNSPQCFLRGFVLTRCKWLLSRPQGAWPLEMFSFIWIDPTTGRENICPPLFYLTSLPDVSTFPICKPDKHIVRQICYFVIWMSRFQKSSIKFYSLKPSSCAFHSFLLVNTFLIIRCPEQYHLSTLQVQFPGAVYCDSRAFEVFLPFAGYLSFPSFISRHLAPSYFQL